MQKILDHLSEWWTPTDRHREPYAPVQRWALLIIFIAAIVVRFWGLGSIGLHGDEETMALAVDGILKHGAPYLPSGMLYPRGLGQLYLMAASVSIFGETEWALRLPSALCGLAVVGLAFLVGRRFLHPQWNLAFTAAVALLPEFIVYSQTARMYIFLVACVAALLWLTFEWERTGKIRYLVFGVLVTLLGIHFHELMVFSSLILLFAPLIRDDARELRQAIVALIVIGAGFFFISHWIDRQYGDLPPIEEATGSALRPWLGVVNSAYPLGAWQILLALAIAGGLSWMLARRLSRRSTRWTCAVLVGAAFFAQLFLFYHLAAMLLAAVVIVALRNGRNIAAPIAALVTVFGALCFVHVILLYNAGLTSGSRLAAAMTGLPSIWPYIQSGQFSHMAMSLAAIGFVGALWQLAHRRRIEDFWVLFVVGSVIPLLTIGVMRWNVPERYTAGTVLPYLVCAFAVLQSFTGWLMARMRPQMRRGVPTAIAVVGGTLIVNPITMACTVNAGYATHPDHKGAAQFVRSLHLKPQDVVLAEDVLQQTYYLGNVSYWLIGWDVARHYVRMDADKPRDIYTSTPVMKSAAEVAALQKKTRGEVYIIGSGENQSDGRRAMRSAGLFELLSSDRVENLYSGRDGLTHVWKLKPLHPRVADNGKEP